MMQPAPQSARGPGPKDHRETLRWCDHETAEGKSANQATIERLEELIKNGRKKEVLKLLEPWPPAAVLSCFVRLKTKRAQKLLRWLSDDVSIRVLAELDPGTHAVLIEERSKAKFRKLMRRMEHNKALRMLKELPDYFAEELLRGHPEEGALRAALETEHTAAGEMRRGGLQIPESWSIGDVIHDIRTRSARIEKIDSLHVIDAEGRLTGYLRIRDLLLHPDQTIIRDVKRPDPIAVSADMDQEEVLKLAKQRQESVLAVVDHDQKLLGVITARELAAIAREEAEEDMLLMGGVSADSTVYDSPLMIVRRRITWLVGGLLGAMLAASVIGSFEHALTRAAILASFIPVVMATAGNAGMQASTVSIQAINSGASLAHGFFPRLAREMAGAALNGLVLGMAVFAIVLLAGQFLAIDRPLMLGATVFLALFGVILFAGTVGTIVPFLLKALKLDPAVATGIFILTANDVFGVLILFGVATALYI